jgi:hypothetical protein
VNPEERPRIGRPASHISASSEGRPSQTMDPRQLTSSEATPNVSETQCGWCGSVIPARRVEHGIRSKRPARWCRPSCRVQASIARKRARRTEGEDEA